MIGSFNSNDLKIEYLKSYDLEKMLMWPNKNTEE